MCEKDYIIWSPATCSWENGKYLAFIMVDSVIMRDEVIEETKTVLIDFNEEKVACKTKKFCILLAFSLITIALWIAVIIYCYLVKHRRKKNIYYHFTSQITN